MWRVVDDAAHDSADESADALSSEHALTSEKGLWGLFAPDTDLSWQHEALCAQTDPEAFFPEKGGSTREAKKVCARCEVREQCLQWAIDHDERFGIWGGMSERERRRYKKACSQEQI
jgi:WhiB family redox-sensing transcriptional regulator